MSHDYYPIALGLSDKPCLLVGGGLIADGKLDALLTAGAWLTVVSPDVTPRIAAFAVEGRITLHRRQYESRDVSGMFLVVAATDDRAANARVAADGRAIGALVNAVDDIPNCDFFAVALVRRGDLQIAISTNGRSPAFARWMRERLDATIPVEYGELLDILGNVRQELKNRGPIPVYEHWQAAITDDVLIALRANDRVTAEAAISQRLTTAAAAGATQP